MTVEHILATAVFYALGHFLYLRSSIGLCHANFKKIPSLVLWALEAGGFFQSYKVPDCCVLSIPFHFYLQSTQFFLKLTSFS